MKTQNKKQNKKIVPIIISGVTLLVAGLLFFLWLRAQPATPSESINVNSSDTQTDNEATKSNDQGSDQTTDEIPIDTTASATIDQLAQRKRNIVAQASVSNVDASGSCSFSFTSEFDDPVQRTTNPVNNGDAIICGPIEISDTEFSYLGEWLLTFRYYVNGKQITAEEKVTIQ